MEFREGLQIETSSFEVQNSEQGLHLEEPRLLYEKQHREELLGLDNKFRFELRVFDLRLPQLRDQHGVVLQD